MHQRWYEFPLVILAIPFIAIAWIGGLIACMGLLMWYGLEARFSPEPERRRHAADQFRQLLSLH